MRRHRILPSDRVRRVREKLPVVLNIYWFEAENDDGPAVPPVNGEEVTAPAAEPKA